MSAHKILYATIGLIVGCLIGFSFANSVNRKELDRVRSELANARKGSAQKVENQRPDGAVSSTNQPIVNGLSEDELRTVINKADASPNDIELQRKVGQGLYLYAVRFNRPDLLPEAIRIIKRAYEADPKNYDTTVLLGNALFDLGQSNNAENFQEARIYYEKALALKPEDVDVRTDLGLSYYFAKPSDPERAIREYRKSLSINPKHEMTLQNLTAALISTGQLAEAERRIDELQSVNSANAALANLRAQLAQAKNAAKEHD